MFHSFISGYEGNPISYFEGEGKCLMASTLISQLLAEHRNLSKLVLALRDLRTQNLI